MKHIAFIKQSFLLVAVALAAMLTGCIKDELAECSKLTLKVEGLNGTDITDITGLGLVEDATLYIFDENKKLLETRKLDKDFILSKEAIKLDNYPDNTKLNIIAWGNLEGGNQAVTDPKQLEDLKVPIFFLSFRLGAHGHDSQRSRTQERPNCCLQAGYRTRKDGSRESENVDHSGRTG